MAVGSAFDAQVKSFLHEKLVGKDPAFEFNTLFEMQVEPHNRDAARRAGQTVFEAYKRQGALADILLDMEGCIGRPRFETAIEDRVSAASLVIGDVPFLGKPDIFFIAKSGARVIFDWKVNGYYSKYNVSPKPGYVRIRTMDKANGSSYKSGMVMKKHGMDISISHPLEQVDETWANQLSIYAWLLGEAVGADFIVAIDQIACGNDGFGGKNYRIAQHRTTVSATHQTQLFKKAHTAWYAIQSGHIFFEKSREESDKEIVAVERFVNAAPDPAFEELFR